MSESKAMEAARKMEEMKKAAIADTAGFPELTDDDRRLWSGLSIMGVAAETLPDKESVAVSRMFAVVITNTGTQSLCDCVPALLKYQEVVDLYNKSRYARIALRKASATEQRDVIEYMILNSADLFLRLDYGNTGICVDIEPYQLLLCGDIHIKFMADWWLAPTVSADTIARHNRELADIVAGCDMADVLPEKLEAVNAIKNAIATGGPVTELVRLYDDAMVDVDHPEEPAPEVAEPVPSKGTTNPVTEQSPSARELEPVVSEQVDAIDAVNNETHTALQQEFAALQAAFLQNSTPAVVVSTPSGGGGSSDGMSGWAVAGLCVAAAGAAYLGYRFFTDGDTQDIIDVDIDDYV